MAFQTKGKSDPKPAKNGERFSAQRKTTGRHGRTDHFQAQNDEHNRQQIYQKYEYHPADKTIRDRSETDGAFVLTGRNPIREALKNGRDLEKLLVQKGELSGSAREIVQKAKERKILVQIVEKSRLDAVAPNHQGLIAFASAYQYSTVEDILNSAAEKGEKPFLIVLDGITDPHNFGAIIRTAECAGIESLQKEGIWFYAVTMNGEDYRKISFEGGVALVIGAEEDGISRLVLEKCDYAVSLPMTGRIESLNASVAAGIMMYRVFDSRQ